MFSPTRRCLLGARGMASTRGGMKRILNVRPSPVTFIQKAVETGVYRSREEVEFVMRLLKKIDTGELPPEAFDEYDLEPRTIVNRFRNNLIRGTSVQDYPVEYHILKLNPPIPEKPRVPVKWMKKMINNNRYKKDVAVNKQSAATVQNHLISEYLKRNDRKQKQQHLQFTSNMRKENTQQHKHEDQYYHNLFGIPTPEEEKQKSSTTGNLRSSLLSQAYEFSMKQYQLMRTQNISEKEALDQVDELLKQDRYSEAKHSRKVRDAIFEQQKNQREGSQKQSEFDAFAAKLEQGDADASSETETEDNVNEKDTTTTANSSNSLPSILSSKPRVIEGILQWNQKLYSVPYQEWTVGASTALDHWIARNVMEINETTWDTLLEGGHYQDVINGGQADDTDNSHYYLDSLAADLVQIRETLFPETQVPSRHQQGEDVDDFDFDEQQLEDQSLSKSNDEDEDDLSSFDELLQSLRTSRSNDDLDDSAPSSLWQDIVQEQAESETDAASSTTNQNKGTVLQQKVDQLTDELQDYRRKHQNESKYEMWPENEKKEFMLWLKQYVSTVHEAAAADDIEDHEIDYDATRETLLNLPPVTREGSQEFWDSIQDDVQAEVFLQQLHEDYEKRTTSSDNEKAQKDLPYLHYESFMELPYDMQLQQLRNLGTLRPIYEEYNTSGSSSLDGFLQRYGHLLLENVVVEHLIPDPNGPISAKELGPAFHDMIDDNKRQQTSSNADAEEQRFRMVMLPYGSTTRLSGGGRNQPGSISDVDGSSSSVVVSSKQSERSRVLYYLWNQFKANRARYEETMFRMDQLGLRYETDDEKTRRKKNKDKRDK